MNTPDCITDTPPFKNNIGDWIEIINFLHRCVIPMARPMLKSASEFLKDSGRKAPVSMILRLFFPDFLIFSTKEDVNI